MTETEILRKHGIQFARGLEYSRATEVNYPEQPLREACIEILTNVGVPKKLAKMYLDGDKKLGGRNGKYDYFKIDTAIDIADKIKKDNIIEIGLKYPEFNAGRLKADFNLSPLSKEYYISSDTDYTTPKTIFNSQMMIISSDKDCLGKNGYVGVTISTANKYQEVFDFLEWLRENCTYVKDIDILSNSLGGLEHRFLRQLGLIKQMLKGK